MALAKFQDKETGMRYQIIDKLEKEDNRVESSCTSLFDDVFSSESAMAKIAQIRCCCSCLPKR